LRPAEQGFLITFEQSAKICKAFYGGFFEAVRQDE